MLGLALIVLAAKVVPPPPAHCEDGKLVLQATYGDIVITSDDVMLRDAKPAVKNKASEASREKSFAMAGESSTLTVKPEGWSLTKGEATMAVEMPKGAKGGETRPIGVIGQSAWLIGQYWIARVDLTTGDVLTGKLARDGKSAIILDTSDGILLVNGDRLYRCAQDAVCTETAKLPISTVRASIGKTGFLLASDGTTDKVVRVARDKLGAPVAIETGSGATFCPLGNGEGATYTPSTAWFVNRVSSENGDVSGMTRDRLLGRALARSPAIGASSALFDTALREKWPELEALGLVATRDARPELRAIVASAFATVPSTRGYATLWLLGRDPDATVRGAALDATARWCSKQRVVPCTSALKQYLADPASDVSWLARDLLLLYDPLAALRDAPIDYRRDAVSHLAALLLTSSNPGLLVALQSLTIDADPNVRAAALQTIASMGL
ncbi:MAG: hypothetical protein ACAI38_19040 [Myxococcota bacterium]